MTRTRYQSCVKRLRGKNPVSKARFKQIQKQCKSKKKKTTKKGRGKVRVPSYKRKVTSKRAKKIPGKSKKRVKGYTRKK